MDHPHMLEFISYNPDGIDTYLICVVNGNFMPPPQDIPSKPSFSTPILTTNVALRMGKIEPLRNRKPSEWRLETKLNTLNRGRCLFLARAD